MKAEKFLPIVYIMIIAFILWLVIHKVADALNLFESKPKPGGLFGDGLLDANGNPTGEALQNISNFQPEAYSNAIYQDINELIGIRNVAAYNDLLMMSNDELILVYNDWLDRYFDDNSETLTEAISGEIVSWFDTSFRDLRDAVVERLQGLNLA